MPELWVNLNIDEELVPTVHDLDLRNFYGRDADAVLKTFGLKTLDEMHTETFEEWEYYRESTPEQFRTDWNPDNEVWTSVDYGLEWADRLKTHLDQSTDFGVTWPYDEDNLQFILEELANFRAVLVQAKKHGAEFRISYGT